MCECGRARESRGSRRGRNGGSGDTQSKVNDARTAKRSAATVNSRLLRTLPSQRKKYTDERCIASSSARVLVKSISVNRQTMRRRATRAAVSARRVRPACDFSQTSLSQRYIDGSTVSRTVMNHANKQERLGAGKIRSVKAMAQEGSVCACVRGAVCDLSVTEMPSLLRTLSRPSEGYFSIENLRHREASAQSLQSRSGV